MKMFLSHVDVDLFVIGNLYLTTVKRKRLWFVSESQSI